MDPLLAALNSLAEEVGTYRCNGEQYDKDQQDLSNGRELCV
jgi:hypothetical protein